MLMLSRLKFPITPLVNEMLDQLPAEIWTSSTTTFLDPAMAGGQFLVEIQRRLREAGHTDENIASRMYGCEKNKMRVNYAKNSKKLVTSNLCISDFLSYDWGTMKFDVIVGNPPYQNGNEKGGKSSLWRKFVSTAWSIVRKDGYLAMIVPHLSNNADDIGHIFVENQTTHVWKNVAHYFPGVGSSFTAWIVCKQPTSGPTLFVQENLRMTLDTNKLPKKIEAISIIDKFNSWPSKIQVRSSSQYFHTSVADGKDDQHLCSRPSPALPYKMRRTNGDTTFMWGAVEPDDYHKPKITFTYSGNPGFLYHTAQEPVGTIGFMSGHVLVKNQNEALSLISLYNTKAYRFVRDQITSGGMKGRGMYEQPALPLDRIWTDQEVYQALKLSKIEIDLIESLVK
jgi:hypothetical protein